jgi:invasion protein IalB
MLHLDPSSIATRQSARLTLTTIISAALVSAGLVGSFEASAQVPTNQGANSQTRQTAPLAATPRGPNAIAQAAAAPPPAAAATPAVPAAPARIETIVYDSWTVSCRDTVGGPAKKMCSMSLQLIDKTRGQVLLMWTIGRNTEGNMLTAIQTPTGVQIKRGVEVKLGNSAVRKLDYTSCEQARCEASGPLEPAMTKDLTAAANATATIYALDGRGINFNLPTTGVDKAFAALGK